MSEERVPSRGLGAPRARSGPGAAARAGLFAALVLASLASLGSPRRAAASVTLTRFWASSDAAVITLHWETATEQDTVGFRLRRAGSRSGPFEVLGGSFVVAVGGPAEGGVYSWRDHAVAAGRAYYYKLDSVRPDQSGLTYDPVVCAMTGGAACAPEPTATPTPTASPSSTARPSASPRPPSSTPRPTATRRPSGTPRPAGGADPSATARGMATPRPTSGVEAGRSATPGPSPSAAPTAAQTALPAAGFAVATPARTPRRRDPPSPAAGESPAAWGDPAAGAVPAGRSTPEPSPSAAAGQPGGATAAPPAEEAPPASRVGSRILGGAGGAAAGPAALPGGLVAAGLGLLLAALAWRMRQLVRRA